MNTLLNGRARDGALRGVLYIFISFGFWVGGVFGERAG